MKSSNKENMSESSNKIMIVDGANFMHRARAGFQLGEHNVCFNFFRNFRALVEMHKPSRVIFVLEGHPKKRYEMLPEYKANRKIELVEGEPQTPEIAKKVADLTNFFRQTPLIVDLLSKYFPVSVVRHPDHEGDDTIYNLINRSSSATPWIVVSNDSDFTQLLNDFHNVKVYNPIAKTFVTAPPYDYVSWKALRGDGSDNIPGLPGISDAKAEELVVDGEKLQALFENQEQADMFTRNYKLIKFMTWTDEEALQMTSSSPTKDWDAVAAKFNEWLFKSITKEGTWEKYKATFDHLFGE